MRHFVYRDSLEGMYDWFKEIKYCIHLISFYEKIKESYLDSWQKERYTEAIEQRKYYEEFLGTLNKSERYYVDCFISHHYPDNEFYCHNHVNLRRMYLNWQHIIFVKGNGKLIEITNKEVGKVIKEARKFAHKSRKEVADIIGINQNTLKAYENGIRTLPFDVFYKLNQFLDLCVIYNKLC